MKETRMIMGRSSLENFNVSGENNWAYLLLMTTWYAHLDDWNHQWGVGNFYRSAS